MILLLRRLTDLLLYANFFIAAAAVAVTWQTQLLTGIYIPWYYYAFVFFATLFTYHFDRFIGLPQKQVATASGLMVWLSHSTKGITRTLIATAFILTILVWWLPIKLWLFMGHLGLLSIAYGLPIFGNKGNKFSLRSLTGVKLLLISYVWAAATVVAPMFLAGIELNNTELLWLGLERLLFVMVLCIPFDIRDCAYDVKENTRTLAVVFGASAAKLICLLLLVLFTIICGIHYGSSSQLFLAHAISATVAAIAILPVKPGFTDYYLLAVIDAQLIIQPLMVYFILNR